MNLPHRNEMLATYRAVPESDNLVCWKGIDIVKVVAVSVAQRPNFAMLTWMKGQGKPLPEIFLLIATVRFPWSLNKIHTQQMIMKCEVLLSSD